MTGEGSMSRCSPKGDLSVILPSLDGAESVLVVKLSGGYDYWVSPAGCMGWTNEAVTGYSSGAVTHKATLWDDSSHAMGEAGLRHGFGKGCKCMKCDLVYMLNIYLLS